MMSENNNNHKEEAAAAMEEAEPSAVDESHTSEKKNNQQEEQDDLEDEDVEEIDDALRCYQEDNDDEIEKNNDGDRRGYRSDDSEDPDPALTGIEREPSYKKANSIKFAQLCQRLEAVTNAPPKTSRQDKLKTLLPPMLLEKIKPESLFPLFRLLIPEHDSRRLVTKESTLATAYCDAFHFDKNSQKSKMLHNYTDPVICASIHSEKDKVAGDFTVVLEKVLCKTVSKTPSKATVGDINKRLDKLTKGLASAKSGGSNQKWHTEGQSQSQTLAKKKKGNKKKRNQRHVRERFVRALKDDLHLSPMEHKWLVRIILGNGLKIHVGWESILKWYSPHAMDLWKAHNNLKAVCNKLCNQGYMRQREIDIQDAQERMKEQRFNQLFTFPANNDPVRIGNVLSAMKSERTSFEKLMADMSSMHKGVVKKIDKNDPVRDSLALNFPAFIAEVKLDGERMILTINRGKVTMHSRNGKWYSCPYSPIVGPALRQAISKYDVDVVLDGEIIAWDDGRQETIPFGSNRTVAIMRQKFLAAHGEIEDIDRRLHEGEEEDANVMRYADIMAFSKIKPDDDDDEAEDGSDVGSMAGKECWLTFVAFDVLYVDGPDAKKLLTESLSPEPAPSATGSVTHLSGFERKRILYRLIEPQKKKVEIVETLVIRPNGECSTGEDYFSPSNPCTECGLPAFMLDSAKWTLNVGHKSLKEFDAERRKGREDKEISKRRTNFVNRAYHEIVEVKKREGLLVKDLAAPYILKNKTSRWCKIKPDFAGTSCASDIDVVVIGGTFASGLRRAGEISSFLCGCVDSQDPEKFFTLCRINANSLKNVKVDKIMELTGFAKATNDSPVKFGKWFREEEHGVTLPDFISMRSFQDGQEDHDGWRFEKVKTYPDLFIRPEDSVVLTLDASEIVPSDEYSAGITLRFPRARKVRIDADEKPVSEIHNEQDLYEIYNEYKSKMKEFASSAGFQIDSPSKNGKPSENETFICRFLTVEEYLRRKRSRQKKTKATGLVEMVEIKEKESNALTGLKFSVLEGPYNFDQNGIDAEEARSEGWFDEVMAVRQSTDVASFIIKHNGTVLRSPGPDTYDIGGSEVDLKVLNRLRGFDVQKDKASKKKKKQEDADTNNVKVPGILKFSYVYALVYRVLSLKNRMLEEASDSSLDEEDDDDDKYLCTKLRTQDVLRPRFFDYLARSEKYAESKYESIWRCHDLDVVGMKRALSFLQDSSDTPVTKRSKQSGEELDEIVPWQCAALRDLPSHDRWVMACEYEKLWPYGGKDNAAVLGFSSANDRSAVIVYPDLFGNDFGLRSQQKRTQLFHDGRADQRWKEVAPELEMGSLASSLPLLRAMGCFVTPHLHAGVTHVLCNMSGNVDSVVWRPGTSVDSFCDIHHGQKLSERLNDTFDRPVMLVSRTWVGSHWG